MVGAILAGRSIPGFSDGVRKVEDTEVGQSKPTILADADVPEAAAFKKHVAGETVQPILVFPEHLDDVGQSVDTSSGGHR